MTFVTDHAWCRLLWASILFCLACTVCSRTLPGSNIRYDAAKDAGSKDAFKQLLDQLKTQQAFSPSGKPPPAAREDTPGVLAGAQVTGFFFSPDPDLPNNRFDPAIGTLPDICQPPGSSSNGCGNLQSNINVPILDVGSEFVTVSGPPVSSAVPFTNLDLLDIDTRGVIIVGVARFDTNTTRYTGGKYILESPALRQFAGVNTSQSQNIPADVQVNLSGDEDLAAGRFEISIPEFSFPTVSTSGATFIFRLLLEPRPRECEPGANALCCDQYGLLLSGNTCRTAVEPCEADTTCNGKEPTCPVTLKPNGTDCPNGKCQSGVCVEVPRECEPGPNALCCSPEGKLLKGDTCRTAAGLCEDDTTCNGKDPTCPVTLKPDGTDCPYDPVEGFPWFSLNVVIGQAQDSAAKGQNVVTESGAVLDFLNHNQKCTGTCYAGKCVLDTSAVGDAPCWEQGANLLTCVPPTVSRLLQLLKKHC